MATAVQHKATAESAKAIAPLVVNQPLAPAAPAAPTRSPPTASAAQTVKFVLDLPTETAVLPKDTAARPLATAMQDVNRSSELVQQAQVKFPLMALVLQTAKPVMALHLETAVQKMVTVVRRLLSVALVVKLALVFVNFLP